MTARRRPPLGLIYAITLTGILANSLLSPAIPDVLDEFGQDDSQAGILVAVGALPGIFVAPFIGIAADRLGRKVVLVPCLLVFGVAGLVAALAPSFEVLLLARLLMGFGSGGLINLAVVMIGDNWSGTDRTRLVGRNAAVLTIGLATAPLLSGFLTDVAGWRWALALYATALVTALGVIVSIDNVRPEQTGDLRHQLAGAGRILRQPVMIATLVTGVITFALIFGIFLATLPLHLEQEFGLSAGWRGVVIAIPAISSTVVSANLSRIRSAIGLRAMLVVGSALMVLAFLLLGATGALILVIFGAIGYGLGEGSIIPALQDVTVTLAPTRYRGGVLAVWVAFARLGQTIGPLAAAATTGATSTSTTMTLGGVVALALVAIALLGPISDRAVAATAAPPD